LGKTAYDALTQEESKPDRIIFKRDGQVIAEYPFDEAVRRVKTGEIPLTDTYWHEGMEEWKLVSESAAGRTVLRQRGEIPELPFPRTPTIDELKVVRALLTNLQAAEAFYVWPDIPKEKLVGAESTFLHLRDDELLLALCDTMVLAKNAKDGFAFTTKRVYWRDLWSSPKEIEYAYLVGPVEMKSGRCELGRGNSVGGPFPDMGDIPGFLRSAARVFGTPLKVSGSTDAEEDLDELIKPHLAKLDRRVGLKRVKKDLRDLTNLVRNNLVRKNRGSKSQNAHCTWSFMGRLALGKPRSLD
jgi:hypothetical protein